MGKFKVEFKIFMKVFKYALLFFGVFGLSAFIVDQYGAESTIAKILSFFWGAVLVGGIIFFTGLIEPIKKGFFKLIGLVFKKNAKKDVPNK